MKKLAVKVWRLFFFANFFCTLIFFYPFFRWWLFSGPRWYKTALKVQRFWAGWLLFWSGIRVRIQHAEPLPEGPKIWVANHCSALDILIMYDLVPEYFHFVAKRELANHKLFGVMFGKTHIPILRDSMTDSFKAMQRAADDIKNGSSIVLFPEGTMQYEPGKMNAFKNGAFKLSADTGAPVIPVAFPDNLKRLPFTYNVLYPAGGPGKVRVLTGRPLYPADFHNDVKALSEAAEQQILEMLGQ